jgi:hypothetical protein
MIDVACPQCGVVYHTLEANIGKRILCTNKWGNGICGFVIAIVPPVAAQQPPSFSRVERPAAPSAVRKRRVHLFAVAAIVIAVALASSMLQRHGTTAKGMEAPRASQAIDAAGDGEKRTGVGGEPHQVPAPPDFSDIDQFVRTEKSGVPKSGSSRPSDRRPTEYNSLPTGTRIQEDIGTGGHGELTVENGTAEDAVVRLSDVAADQTMRWFFVQTHSSAHVPGIPQGSYRLTYTTGIDWIESEDSFRWHPSYSQFERAFDYSENRDSEGVQYKTISVTLQPVPSGNVRTRAITREQFLSGHRHVALQRYAHP